MKTVQTQAKYCENKGILKTVRKCIKDKFGLGIQAGINTLPYPITYCRIFTEYRKNGSLRSKYWCTTVYFPKLEVKKYVNKKFGKLGVKADINPYGDLVIYIDGLKNIKQPISNQSTSFKYSDINQLQGTRKPNDTEDVDFVVLWNEMETGLQFGVNSLPVKTLHKNYFRNGGSFFDNMGMATQFYLIKWNNETYFVDSQGYDYARYVTRLV